MGKRTDEVAGGGADATYVEEVDVVSVSGMVAPGAVPSGSIPGAGDIAGAYATEGAFDEGSSSSGPDDIEQTRTQIQQTREHMSQTIDEIQERLSPQHIAQQAKDTVRDATIGKATTMVNDASDSAKGLGAGIIDTIKQNPVPAALAGFGIGWLFMSGRKSGGTQTYGYRAYDYGSGYGYDRGQSSSPGIIGNAQQAVGNVAGQAQSTLANVAGQAQGTAGNVAGQVQDAVGQVQDTAGQVVGQVQDTAGQLASGAQSVVRQAGDTMSDLGSTAQFGMSQAGNGFQQMLRQNPLGVAAGALAIGLAVGLAIPETDKENEIMGPARDNLMQQAQESVQQTAQKVQSVAQEAVGAATDAAKQEADNQGLSQS